jgi:hypothetical protein
MEMPHGEAPAARDRPQSEARRGKLVARKLQQSIIDKYGLSPLKADCPATGSVQCESAFASAKAVQDSVDGTT